MLRRTLAGMSISCEDDAVLLQALQDAGGEVVAAVDGFLDHLSE